MLDVKKPAHLFPFSDAMAFGFGVLHLSSDEFWKMTPRELRAAAKPYRKSSNEYRITRENLETLMNSFPDLAPKE